MYISGLFSVTRLSYSRVYSTKYRTGFEKVNSIEAIG